MTDRHIRPSLTLRLGSLARVELETAAANDRLTVSQYIADRARFDCSGTELIGELYIRGTVYQWHYEPASSASGTLLLTGGHAPDETALARRLGAKKVAMTGHDVDASSWVVWR